MPYVPPFEVLRREFGITAKTPEQPVELSYAQFIGLIRQFLAAVPVNEAWYLTQYDDIGKAVRQKKIASGAAHFIQDGYFEGRRPFPIAVDEAWYLKRYPDVADGIRRGVIASAQTHFDQDGYNEGRLPRGD